jgi:hypothetical protein
MKTFQWTAAVLLVVLAQFAHADTFDITQITITVFFGNENVFFDLSGPGTKITGEGGIACEPTGWCNNPVFPPGSVLTNIGPISIENFNDAKVGGTSFGGDEFGFTSSLSVDVLGSIILPVSPHGSTFTACVPATMSGPVTGNAGSGESFTQFTLQMPVGGRFCTTWFFGGGVYQFERGTFFVSTVPEPGTLGFMGTGLGALIAVVSRRRHCKQATHSNESDPHLQAPLP